MRQKKKQQLAEVEQPGKGESITLADTLNV
jgi:hypothetical protein